MSVEWRERSFRCDKKNGLFLRQNEKRDADLEEVGQLDFHRKISKCHVEIQ
jgi:hypothetical protein